MRGCLNKTPKLRPTYAMLQRHAWLAPLLKPPTITEDDEKQDSEASEANPISREFRDREVANWVADAMERRRNGSMGKKAKPALHAAPLDAVSSPSKENVER